MHNKDGNQDKIGYAVQDFIPLIVIIAIIILFTLVGQVRYGLDGMRAMHDSMGGFFLIFGLFKVANLRGFVDAYRTYDLVAQRSVSYAYLYPFIECALGLAYLGRYYLLLVYWITLVLMIISAVGVARALGQKNQIMCACLGAVFKIPMTYVTLVEDLVMGSMALGMLVYHYWIVR